MENSFFTTKPLSSWLRRKVGKASAIGCAIGARKCVQHVSNAAGLPFVSATWEWQHMCGPPYSHRNPYALGAFPRGVQGRPPNRTNHCWLKVSTRGCRQFWDTVQCSQGTQGHRHKIGIWRADLLDQWPYLDEEEFRQMNAVFSCP